MGSCCLGTCTNPTCDLCLRVAKIQPPEPCGKPVTVGKRTDPCTLIKGHDVKGYPYRTDCRSRRGKTAAA
jgi:hypothetical protein